MDRFPMMLFRQPGTERMHGDAFATCIVQGDGELADALADGWHESTTAASDAFKAANAAPAPVQEDAPPTRAELEQKAGELGIKVDARWGDKRLGDEIDKAMKG